MNAPFTLSGTGIYRLADDLTMGSTKTLNLASGTFDANDKNVTVGLFSSSNSNTRTITVGSGTWTITGNNGTVWGVSTVTNLTQTTRPIINFSYAGGTGTRTISTGTISEGMAPDINVTAGTDTVVTTINVNNLNFTGFSGTLSNGTHTVYGSLTLSTGMTLTDGASITTMGATSGTKTITSNGKTFGGPLTLDGVGGTFLLVDHLTLPSGRALTLTNGVFNANDKNVSVGVFSSSNSNTRTLTAGSGTWTITGSGATVWSTNTATNLTMTTKPTISLTYSGSTGTRTINTGVLNEGFNPNINITAGTDTIALTNGVGNLDFTGFSGTLSNGARTVYGSLTLSTGMTLTDGASITTMGATSGTKTITSNGRTFGGPITISGVGGTFQLADDLAFDSARTLTLTAGTFDANNRNVSIGRFSSNNSNTRTLTVGSGTWTITGNSATVWTTQTVTGLTMTTKPTLTFNYSGSTGTRTINTGALPESLAPNLHITAGTDSVNVQTTNIGDLDFTGFAGTLANNSRTVYGNLTFSSGMAITGGGTTSMGATSGTKTITTNGNPGINIGITINGVGGTFQLADDLTLSGSLVGSRFLILSGGTFDANGHNVTIPAFSSNSANTSNARTLTMGSGTWTLTNLGTIGTIWNTSDSAGLTVNPNTSTVILTGTSTEIDGSNVFYNLTKTVSSTDTLTFEAGTTQTISGTLTLQGASGNFLTLRSTTPGTQWSINPQGVRTLGHLDVQDSRNINATAIASDGFDIGNSGNNTNWGFPGEASGVVSGSRPTIKSIPFLETNLDIGKTMTIEQIKVLLAELTAELNRRLSYSTATSTPSFSRNLKVGMIGEDVRALQVFLNTHGFEVATTGAGSLGNETTMFGNATKEALIKFQIKNNITPAIGYFGEKTRKKVDEVLVPSL